MYFQAAASQERTDTAWSEELGWEEQLTIMVTAAPSPTLHPPVLHSCLTLSKSSVCASINNSLGTEVQPILMARIQCDVHYVFSHRVS